MINFKEHDGLIFKMLDKPVPLTPDAKFPCVVRLIQDDSPMGRYNQSYSEYRYGVRLGCCMLPIIATHIAKNGVVNDIEWDVSRYEIIGYPVADGSKEWALYQMMQGKMVCHKTSRLDWYRMYSDHAIQNRTAGCMPRVSAWLESTVQSGWEIYKEPKEELPKEPDYVICKRCGGSQSIPALSNTAPKYTTCPKCGGTGYEIKETCDAPNPESATQTSLPVSDATQYKVGDWVEHKESKEQATIRRIMSYGAIEIEFAYSTESDIYQANDFHNDFRKLSPSEVIVKIGCLSGTIAKSCDPNYFLMLHSRPATDCNHSLIRFSAIDTETRELVESLLEAQEEE